MGETIRLDHLESTYTTRCLWTNTRISPLCHPVTSLGSVYSASASEHVRAHPGI